MKDVEGCEKSGRVANQTLTPEYLNGETHQGEALVSYTEYIGVEKVSERIETS